MAHTDQRTLGENDPYQCLRLDGSLVALHVAAHAHECRYDNGPQRNGTDEKPRQELQGITCWRGDPVSRTNLGNKKRRCKGNRCPRALGNDAFKKKKKIPQPGAQVRARLGRGRMLDSVFPRIAAHALVIIGNDRSLSEHLLSQRELCSLCFPFWIWAAMI